MEVWGVLDHDLGDSIQFIVKARPNDIGIQIETDIPFQGNGQQISFPSYGRCFRCGQGIAHFRFLPVHHLADAGTCSGPYGSAGRRTDKRAFGITTNGLAQYGTGHCAASSTVGSTLSGFGLGRSTAAQCKHTDHTDQNHFFHRFGSLLLLKTDFFKQATPNVA
jgi:hypothetical protein